MNSSEKLETLMALRRGTRLDEAYWKDFLSEFHQRQRQQVKPSGLVADFSRAAAWLSDLGSSKWAYGVGLAYAAVTVTWLLAPKPVEFDSPVVPVNRQIRGKEKPVETLDSADGVKKDAPVERAF